MVLLFLFSYKFIDNDFLCPLNLYLLFSIVSVGALLLIYSEWKVNEYGGKAATVYLTGSLCFLVGCCIARLFSQRQIQKKKQQVVAIFTNARIDIGMFKLCVVLLTGAIALYGTYSYLMQVSGYSVLSVGSIGQAIQKYRDMVSQGLLSGDEAKSSLWRLFSYLLYAFSYCTTFVFIKNLVNRQFRAKDLLLLIPFVLRCTECLLQSNRGGIIQLFFAAIISWFISTKFRSGWRKKVNAKVVKIGLRVAVVLIPLFFGSLILMGRYDSLKGLDIKNYSLTYLSGGVRNLDLYMKDPGPGPETFGEETFVTLHTNLYISYGIGKNIVRFQEFRDVDGRNTGNIYTAFRRFYRDFGFLGICILPLLQGILISMLYYRIVRNPRNDKLMFKEVLYCLLAYTTIYLVLDDLFYSSWFSITGIKMLIIAYAAYFFLFGISIDRRGKLYMEFGPLRLVRREHETECNDGGETA